MSRKRKAPKKIPIVDPRYKSAIIPKLINSIMYDGKKTVAEELEGNLCRCTGYQNIVKSILAAANK